MRDASLGQIDNEESLVVVEWQLAPNCVLKASMAKMPFMALTSEKKILAQQIAFHKNAAAFQEIARGDPVGTYCSLTAPSTPLD